MILMAYGLSGQEVVDSTIFATATVEPVDAYNTEDSDFLPFLADGQLYYTQETKDDESDARYYRMVSPADNGLTFYMEEAHVGPGCYSAQSGMWYVTVVEDVKNDRTGRVKSLRRLYQISLVGDQMNYTLLPFNDDIHHVCHPAINDRGDYMIFAADFDANTKMDLYESVRMNEVWTAPQRLPNLINTDDNEYFPSLMGDSILIFSSDRGGDIDIFTSKRINDTWNTPQRLPYPINSRYDDIGCTIAADGMAGYISSNRPGGKGSDDIYAWHTDEAVWYDPTRYQEHVQVSVLQKLGFTPIDGAQVSIYKIDLSDKSLVLELLQGSSQGGELLLKLKPENMTATKVWSTDTEGKALLSYDNRDSYIVKIAAPDYQSYTFILKGGDDVNVLLEPGQDEVVEVKEVEEQEEREVFIPSKRGEVAVFESIYFDYNSSSIKEGAAKELDALAQAMLARPTMVVQLGSHTDSRGAKDYNQKLSEDRATSALLYLMRKGIDKSRIYTIGYGESRPRNHCTDGVSCSEEEYRYNRRIEVKLIQE